MNIAGLKIRSHGFPHLHLRVHLFHRTPGYVTDTFTVLAGRNEKKVKITSFSVYLDDNSSNGPSFLHNPVSFSTVD